jgi:glycogen debranching enzyme
MPDILRRKSTGLHEAPCAELGKGALQDLPDHYIEASGTLVRGAQHSLKHGDAFAVFDAYGDIGVVGAGPDGLYFNDTRFLSWFELLFDGTRPLLLSSVVQDDNAALSVDLTNPDIHRDGVIVLPRDTIAIERTKFLWREVCYERIGFRNFANEACRFRIDIGFGADFRDLFEVRGSHREKRGRTAVRVEESRVEFSYHGLDGLVRRTRLEFAPAPVRIGPHRASFEIEIGPVQNCSLRVFVQCEDRNTPVVFDFARAFRERRRDIRSKTGTFARVESSNELFDELCARSIADLGMLMTKVDHGLYPYAGIPWYSTPFGRDGIITAMMLLWLDPSIAQGALQYLGMTQAQVLDPSSDAQPGKILHEARNGEMALLGEVPFRRYYGSVDATPLYVMLAGMYFDRTGNIDFIMKLWPRILAALHWIDTYGDLDGDGFVEYARQTEAGLTNQGWKDSHDSVFHADGSLAEGPIALCEVQGYVYSAKRHAAKLAHHLGERRLEARLTAEADELKQRFDEAFWCDEIGTFGLALDGRKALCRVRTSNAGHALFSGIAEPNRAQKVAASLLGRDFFTGWGIRTVARTEARYNPISYHNGSVWPHDNAMIALGLARYDLGAYAAEILAALFAAAKYEDLRRLPELFCGFIRRPHRGPTGYPVACAPQAWAAAAPFACLEACLGLELRHATNALCFVDPVIPEFLDHVTIRQLRLRDSVFDLELRRHGKDTTLTVLNRRGDAKVMLVK